MAGQPRTRLARQLAAAMARQLREHGPEHLPQLLARQGYRPPWDDAPDWILAACRMSVARLLNEHGARVDLDGRLFVPRQRAPRRREPAAFVFPAEWNDR